MVFDTYSRQFFDNLKKKASGEPIGIPSPFPTLNEVSQEEAGRIGPARGWFVTVGGADGSGKSYLGVNLAAHGVANGYRVGVINFELSKLGYATRFLPILADQPKYQFEIGEFFNESTWESSVKYFENVTQTTGGSIAVNDEAAFSIDDMKRIFNAWAARDVDMIIVDYVQLINVPGIPPGDLVTRTEVVSNTLREMAHQSGILTYSLSQFNREGKKSQKGVSRHNLYGGGSAENNSNMVVLIDHTSFEVMPGIQKQFNLIVDKNRHGPAPVRMPVRWDLSTFRWTEISGAVAPSSGADTGTSSGAGEYEVVPAPDLNEQETFF